MLNPFLLWSCSSLKFGYLLICSYTGQCALWAWILSRILVSLLAFDKILLCSPCTDVWQLRRGSWWWPGQHVSCASHHPSTVFPFTPAANGPKLQETSHCCFSQSVTQASSKLKNVLPLSFFFLFLYPLLCSLPLFLSPLCSLIVVLGSNQWNFACMGPNRLRIKAGWRWARSRVNSWPGCVLGKLIIPIFTGNRKWGRGKTVYFVFTKTLSQYSFRLWPERKAARFGNFQLFPHVGCCIKFWRNGPRDNIQACHWWLLSRS